MALRSLLIFAACALAAPASVPNTTSSAAACAASMNGQLPEPLPVDFHFSGNIRRYYIAAEQIEWDYAPTGWDNWLGVPLHVSPRAKKAGVLEYGTKWTKAVYREYTDDSFTQKSPRPAWQGIQGPTIRSEVGDMIEILFLNRLPTQFASMHSMGLAYTKDNEGAAYPNGTALNPHPKIATGDAVPPGGCFVYKWLVTDPSGPQPGTPSKMHGYHSYVSEPQDVNSGLVGPQITYARGQMNQTMSEYREFPLLYMTFDESESTMAQVNAAKLKKGNASASSSSPDLGFTADWPAKYGNQSFWHPQLVNLMSADGFDDAPEFHAINGYIFGNNPPFEMCLNDKVVWYLQGKSSHPARELPLMGRRTHECLY